MEGISKQMNTAKGIRIIDLLNGLTIEEANCAVITAKEMLGQYFSEMQEVSINDEKRHEIIKDRLPVTYKRAISLLANPIRPETSAHTVQIVLPCEQYAFVPPAFLFDQKLGMLQSYSP